MMKRVSAIVLPLAVLYSPMARAASDPIRTLAQAMEELHAAAPSEAGFSLTCLVTHVCQAIPGETNRRLIVSAGAINGYARCELPLCPQAGEIVRLEGKIYRFTNGRKFLQVLGVAKVGHAPVPTPVETTAEQLLRGSLDYRPVSIRGIVTDVRTDDIDTQYEYLTLKAQGQTVLASRLTTTNEGFRARDILDAQVRLTGICRNATGDTRLLIEHLLDLDPEPHGVRILTPAPKDPFAVPPLESLGEPLPSNLIDSGKRRVQGRTLATWCRQHCLLKTRNGKLVAVTFRRRDALPAVGDFVTVAGYPATDLFHVRLTNACFRREAESVPEAGVLPNVLNSQNLLEDTSGQRQFNGAYNGKLVRLTGVAHLSPTDSGRFTLSCGRHLIPVEADSIADGLRSLEEDSTVEVTGICLLETDTWQPNLVMPHVNGMFLVPRHAADIRILARPPWWTPGRFFMLIGILLTLVIAVTIWNRVLNRLVVRRSRELLKEQVASTTARLRIDERTRLAAELHDSLSQNLSAIACQVNVAKLTSEAGSESHKVLETAERMLQSCRTELTRCLWDLRSDTLEEQTFTAAIRKTLDPLVLPVKLTIRFNVLRSHVSDSTAHAVLCVIRELVANAVRHGRATAIRIAGSLDKDRLLFSVSDDGGGFDIARHPGVNDGHFGLAGIQDRVNRLYGTFKIRSDGTGTTARIAIPLTKVNNTEESAL